MKRIIFQSLIFMIMMFWVSTALGQTLSLEWDPNSDPNVAGYMVYYQAGSPQPPFFGNEAVQGGAPIDVGSDNFLSLDLPDDGRVYYFAVTAYDNSGYESAYSNIVANRPRPVLVTPALASQLADPTVTFSWFHEVTDPQTTYTLIIGPEAEVVQAGFFSLSGQSAPTWWLVALAMAGGWFLVFRFRCGTRCKMLLVVLLGTSLITACGGGGGGEFEEFANNDNIVIGEVDSTPTGENTVSPGGNVPGVEMPVAETFVISEIPEQSHDVVGLEPGQTYYWKIVAVDGQGQEVESEVNYFTTPN